MRRLLLLAQAGLALGQWQSCPVARVQRLARVILFSASAANTAGDSSPSTDRHFLDLTDRLACKTVSRGRRNGRGGTGEAHQLMANENPCPLPACRTHFRIIAWVQHKAGW